MWVGPMPFVLEFKDSQRKTLDIKEVVDLLRPQYPRKFPKNLVASELEVAALISQIAQESIDDFAWGIFKQEKRDGKIVFIEEETPKDGVHQCWEYHPDGRIKNPYKGTKAAITEELQRRGIPYTFRTLEEARHFFKDLLQQESSSASQKQTCIQDDGYLNPTPKRTFSCHDSILDPHADSYTCDFLKTPGFDRKDIESEWSDFTADRDAYRLRDRDLHVYDFVDFNTDLPKINRKEFTERNSERQVFNMANENLHSQLQVQSPAMFYSLPKPPRPTTFYGKLNQDVDEFLQECDNCIYGSPYKYTEREKINFVASCIKDDARRFYENENQFRDVQTYEECKEKFRGEFKRTVDKVADYFRCVQSTNETPKSYIGRKVYKAKNAGFDTSSQELIEEIIKGLQPVIRDQVYLFGFKSVEELKKTAQRAYEAQINKGHYYTPPPPPGFVREIGLGDDIVNLTHEHGEQSRNSPILNRNPIDEKVRLLEDRVEKLNKQTAENQLMVKKELNELKANLNALEQNIGYKLDKILSDNYRRRQSYNNQRYKPQENWGVCFKCGQSSHYARECRATPQECMEYEERMEQSKRRQECVTYQKN